PPRLLELGDRVLALLEHLLDDPDDARVIERDALVHLALLHGREHEAQGREAILLARLHGGLDVFVQLLAQWHGRLLGKVAGDGPRSTQGGTGVRPKCKRRAGREPGSPRESWIAPA